VGGGAGADDGAVEALSTLTASSSDSMKAGVQETDTSRATTSNSPASMTDLFISSLP